MKHSRDKQRWWRKSKEELKNHPALTAVYFILRFIVVAMLVVNLLEKDYESAFICGLSLILFLLPAFIEKRFRIEIPSLMEVVILLFIFGAEILGELQNYYGQYPYWDTMLHGYLVTAYVTAFPQFVTACFCAAGMDVIMKALSFCQISKK